MIWVVRVGSEEADAALRSASATADDLADAASLPGRMGAERLYRRRLLRGYVARALGVGSGEIGLDRLETGGQRIIAPSPIFVSLAARGSWVAIAASNHPIGVDLETLPAEQPLPLDLLHPRERTTLAEMSEAVRDLAFLRFWTAREAYLKAKERGLPAELSNVEAKEDPDGEGVLLMEGDIVCACATITVTDECVVAVVELRAPE